jgi:uncharacterized membrane protein YhfC
MNRKVRIYIAIILVILALAVLIWNFVNDRKTTFLASIIALLGTIAILVKEIYQTKNR